MLEQVQAQVKHDPFADVLQGVSANEIEHSLRGKDQNQHDRDAVEQFRVIALEHRVDEKLQHVRPGQAQQRADDDGGQSDAQPSRVRLQINHQAAELIPVRRRDWIFAAHISSQAVIASRAAAKQSLCRRQEIASSLNNAPRNDGINQKGG